MEKGTEIARPKRIKEQLIIHIIGPVMAILLFFFSLTNKLVGLYVRQINTMHDTLISTSLVLHV